MSSRDSAEMATANTVEKPANVIEHDGKLWGPRRGATATAEEFVAARTTFIELDNDARWNPWVLDDRAEEHDHLVGVMGQWTRAEPGHRTMTIKQWEARQARLERERAKDREAVDRRREQNKVRYDADRSHARLSFLERQSRLDYEVDELAKFRDGTRFPAMPSDRRATEIAKREESVSALRRKVGQLADDAGDLEDVVDEHGWLPSDRREWMLMHFRWDREQQVRELCTSVPELEAALKASVDRAERAKLRGEVAVRSGELAEMLAIPALTADDMCSECPTPMAKHGWVTPPFKGPCPAWPGWAARIREARELLESWSRRAEPQAPPAPKPQPLAVVPSGLPISEVMARLAEIQERHPTAEVRRGRANRLEIWPASGGDA
jgi:hypothetical protein